MAIAETIGPQLYTIHGPRGVAAARFLRDHAITLSSHDILLIAEHDEATDSWLECEPIPSRPSDGRSESAARAARRLLSTDSGAASTSDRQAGSINERSAFRF